MLLKNKGELKANKLQTTVLLEPDFNYMNKFLGERLLDRAECYGHIAQERFGIRKNHTAINQVVNKDFTF